MKKLSTIMLLALAGHAAAQPNLLQPGDSTVRGLGGATSADTALVARGAYLAAAGDCIACHTAKNGKAFAGGLPLHTPIGTIYSTNITPDTNTGIGNYSYEDFDRALRHGVSKQGYSLYPAMPYPSYAHIKPDDVKALYAYFTRGVAPVAKANVKSDIPWPLSTRWPLAVWRKTFAPAVSTDDASSNSAADPVASGRYLVEGLGHCGACHTPRGTAFQEQALEDRDGAVFLSGGLADGWSADNLHPDMANGLGGWSDKDLVEFLKTGRNAHSAAFGTMADVVRNSTQYMSDEDLFAISSYLKSLPLRNGTQHPLVSDGARAKALFSGDVSIVGAQTFVNSCAACHRTNGEGYAGVFPRLALSAAVNAADPTSLIHIILTGSRMPSTKNAPAAFGMPDFAGRLTDRQIADVVTFVRQSWGNQASAIKAEQVAKIRKDLKP